jgi:hypothetical protein
VALKQPLGVILVAIGGDGKDGVAGGEHAPQRALGALQPPAGLVHVQVLALAHAREQVLVGMLEGICCAREDLLDRAGADARAEQLFEQLGHIAAAHAVARREHPDSGFKAWTEGAL